MGHSSKDEELWLGKLTKYKVPTLESLNIITLKHYCEQSIVGC